MEDDEKGARLNRVYQGSPLTYTIRVANAGLLPAATVNLSDVLPAQMSVVSATDSQGSGPIVVCRMCGRLRQHVRRNVIAT